MKTEAHFNAPVKGCGTCAHCKFEFGSTLYNKCGRFGFHFCTDAIKCCKSEYWQPIPPKPRRCSLRQWLLDTFWTIE